MPSNEDWSADDNIFRCKVNGVDWEPEGNSLGFNGGNLDIYYESFFLNAIQFRASKDNENVNQSLNIGIGVASGVLGTHIIASNTVITDFNCGNYIRDTLAENIIEIVKHDSIFNIIEGTFKLIGNSSDCSVSKVKVTDGYFKAKYRN